MTREEVLAHAKAAVMTDRAADYGEPERNFGVIAEMWTLYTDHQFEPHDVAAMLALLKIARIKSSPTKADHWVDLAGYAACGGEVVGSPNGG